jgi:hypothetical protein
MIINRPRLHQMQGTFALRFAQTASERLAVNVDLALGLFQGFLIENEVA